jgi:hypothetical protein
MTLETNMDSEEDAERKCPRIVRARNKGVDHYSVHLIVRFRAPVQERSAVEGMNRGSCGRCRERYSSKCNGKQDRRKWRYHYAVRI